jgi:hypothetical protein
MFWGISLILLILWYLGSLTGFTLGGIINVLPVIAIIMLAIRVIQEKRYCTYLDTFLRRRIIGKIACPASQEKLQRS